MWIVSPSTSKSFVRASSPCRWSWPTPGITSATPLGRGADREDVHHQRIARFGAAHRDRSRRAVHVREVEVGEDVAHELILARDLTVQAVLHARASRPSPGSTSSTGVIVGPEGPDHLVVGDAVIDGERAHGYLRSGNRTSLPSRRAAGRPRPRPLAWRACSTSPAARRSTRRTSVTSSTASPRSAPAHSDSAPRARPRTARSPTSSPPRCARWGSPRSRSSRCRRRLALCSAPGSPSPAAPTTNARRWAAPRPRPQGGVLAPLVDVGTGERRRLDRLDVAGRIALLDWRACTARSARSAWSWVCAAPWASPSTAPKAGPSTRPSARSARSPRTGTRGAPPFVTMSKEDAAELRRDHGRARCRCA